MKQGKWIRFLSAAASSTALVILVLHREFVVRGRPDDFDVLLYLGLAVAPCFITIFLAAFGRFWWGFAIGLWILYASVYVCVEEKASPLSVILVLCAAAICAAPFLNMQYRSSKQSRKESAQQPPERDR